MLAFAVIYTLLGVGGSVVYAEYAGSQETSKAKRIFTSVLVVSVIIAVIIAVLGFVFADPLSKLICRNAELLPEFLPYLEVLLFSGILIIPLQVLIIFFPSFGNPGVGTAVNIVANAVNLVLDYVYITFFNTGLKGAALATMTGYVFGFILVVILLLWHKIRLPLTRFDMGDLLKVPAHMLRGAAPAINQLGYCIKIAFCNDLALKIAGVTGLGVFSLCMQTVSMVSIIIGGIITAMVPIIAALEGQGDYGGIRLLMRTVMRVQFVSSLVTVLILELFPQVILFIYDVEADIAAPAIEGLRIFSLMFIFRGYVIVFMYYFQVVKRKIYAVVIGLLDGFVGIIPLTIIMTSEMGIIGMWLSYPVLSILILAGILITNLFIARASGGRFRGVALYEYEFETIPTYDVTIELDAGDLSENSDLLQKFCDDSGLDPVVSELVAVASEEMGTYAENCMDDAELEKIDLLVKILDDDVVMDVRTVGRPFDITSSPAEDFSNIDLLRKISRSIDYSYITGMNQTRIRISKEPCF